MNLKKILIVCISVVVTMCILPCVKSFAEECTLNKEMLQNAISQVIYCLDGTVTKVKTIKSVPFGKTTVPLNTDGSIFAYIDGDTLYMAPKNQKDVISLPEDSSGLFANQRFIEEIDLSGIDTSNVNNMSHMFQNCICLRLLNVKDFDTSRVTNMSYMFCNCSSWELEEIYQRSAKNFNYHAGLINLDLRNFDTSKVTDMSYMFYGCRNLYSLNLSKFRTSEVTNMDSMFACCGGYNKAMYRIPIDAGYTYSFERMYHPGLSFLYLNHFDTSKVTNMNRMFYACRDIKNLDISTFSSAKIENNNLIEMFSGCESMETLNLGHFDIKESVKGILKNCKKLKTICCTSITQNSLKNPSICEAVKTKLLFHRFICDKCEVCTRTLLNKEILRGVCNGRAIRRIRSTELRLNPTERKNEVSLNKSKTAVGYIEGDILYISTRSTSYEPITFPSDCSEFFKGLKYLVEVDLSGIDMSSVTNMKAMFFDCRSLEKINFDKFNLNGVTYASEILGNCCNLVNLGEYSLSDDDRISLLSVSETDLSDISPDLFYRCFATTDSEAASKVWKNNTLEAFLER